MIGIEPSLLTAGIIEDDAQTRATSSMTITVATASAPAPAYSSGMCTAWKPAAVKAFCASTGYRSCSSTSAACGAISPSAISRIASRTAWWSSVNVNRSRFTIVSLGVRFAHRRCLEALRGACYPPVTIC
jgi:hypothetical protein